MVGRAAISAFLTGMILTWPAGCEPATEAPPLPRESAVPAGAVKVTPEQDAYPPLLHSRRFHPPEPVPGMNTAGAEDSAFVMPDGSRLYFFFTPDARVPADKQLIDGVTGIYVSEWQGETWGEAQRVLLQQGGEVALDGCVFVQNEQMWFCSARKGNFRGVDMWTATWQDGCWCDWKNAGELLNAGFRIGEMHLSSDGSALYFHSDRPGGRGGYDIWVTRQSAAGWSEPVNLEAINSAETEGWPFLTQDGGELWFTRTYMGTPAVYRSVLGPQGWSPPDLIVSQFAAEPSLDSAGNLYFTHHFFRDGVMLEADIYVARRAS